MRRAWRWMGLWISGVTAVAGMAVFAVYGYQYASETIWLNRQPVPVYQPETGAVAGQTIAADATAPGGTEALGVGLSGGATREGDTSPSAVGTKPLWTPLPADGMRIGTLDIPSLDLTVPILQGTADADLAKGVGHQPGTALPGQPGNVYLAGHRDTVFTRLRYLQKGDRIVVGTPYGNFVYRAVAFRVVPATDVAVMKPTTADTLTLQTCYPFTFIGPAPYRYIVTAELVSAPAAAR
ncbi:MAG: sortase [Alicyclobacillus sp.]|nr:sortase [Alicyclobacillus sp.]